MSKKFVKDKTYVFTSKKFKQKMGKLDKKEKKLVNGINGKQVILHSRFIGIIEDIPIVPEWCKCIKKNPCQRVQ